MISSDFRAEARRRLTGKWGKVALITLVYLAIFFILGFIEGLFAEQSIMRSIISIAVFVIEVPLAFGLIIALFKVYNSEDVKPFEFCSFGFNNFKKSWGITFQMILKLIVPVVLLVISILLIAFGGAFSAATLLTGSSSSGGFLFLTVIGFILYLVAIIWAVVKSYYYSMAYIIAADDESLTAKEAVEKSKEIMTGKRGKLFCLQFSFIGWAILAAFTLGIGYLWLLPYIQFAMIAFYYFATNKESVEGTKVEEDVIKNNDDNTDTLN